MDQTPDNERIESVLEVSARGRREFCDIFPSLASRAVSYNITSWLCSVALSNLSSHSVPFRIFIKP